MQDISVNGIAVDPASAQTPELAAVRELLRQRAQTLGLVTENDDATAVNSAIRTLIEQEVSMPEPTEAECRHYYDTHPDAFQGGERVSARHILFRVSADDSVTMRAKAEQTLADLLKEPGGFEAAARSLSSCPSGRQGGRLGELSRGQTVRAFDEAIFAPSAKGILPQLVETEFGLHIIAVDERTVGQAMPFDRVEQQIAEDLMRQGYERAVRQYVQALAGQAKIVGVTIGSLLAH